MNQMIVIRAERPEDFRAVRRVNEAAFGRPNEADLVETLRKSVHPVLSLVAVEAGQIIGHIFFSPVSVEVPSSRFTALALAPMAVLPEFQRQGIGSLLVRQGLDECSRLGFPVIVVIGHPHYYPRFGFSPARSKGLDCEFPAPMGPSW